MRRVLGHNGALNLLSIAWNFSFLRQREVDDKPAIIPHYIKTGNRNIWRLLNDINLGVGSLRLRAPLRVISRKCQLYSVGWMIAL